MSKVGKAYDPDYILDPENGRYYKRTGARGKELVKKVEEIAKLHEDEKIAKLNEMFRQSFTKTYDKVLIYIYYHGESIDVLHYIKEVQMILDRFNIGSQVQICSNKGFENVGINNCYHTNIYSEDWTKYSTARNSVMAIKINEVPDIRPNELVSVLRNVNEYEDKFITIKEIEVPQIEI